MPTAAQQAAGMRAHGARAHQRRGRSPQLASIAGSGARAHALAPSAAGRGAQPAPTAAAGRGHRSTCPVCTCRHRKLYIGGGLIHHAPPPAAAVRLLPMAAPACAAELSSALQRAAWAQIRPSTQCDTAPSAAKQGSCTCTDMPCSGPHSTAGSLLLHRLRTYLSCRTTSAKPGRSAGSAAQQRCIRAM